MVLDAQTWLDDPGSNFGWLLKAADEGPSRTAKRFDSKDHPTTARRPTVSIDFTPPVAETVFRRGDTNIDGDVDVSDVVFTLQALFGGAGPFDCIEAADANDDGVVDVSDVVVTLLELFVGGLIPDPGPSSCGPDPTEDELECASYEAQCL